MGERWAVDDRRQLADPINVKLDQMLAADEPVRVVIGRQLPLVATDRRVFMFKRLPQLGGLFRSDALSSWDLSEITGVVFQQFFAYGYVALVGPGLQDPQTARQVNLRDSSAAELLRLPNVQRVQGTALPIGVRMDPADLAQRVALLRALVSAAKSVRAPGVAPAQGPDPMDQLRKLAQLRDEGIVTAAEFEAKKAELLGSAGTPGFAGSAARPAPFAPPTPPVAGAWMPTHVVPAEGVAFWVAPDSSLPPAGQLTAYVELVIDSISGGWAQVRAQNGWRGWVDGRLLIPVAST